MAMEEKERLTEIPGEEWLSLVERFKERKYDAFEPILAYWHWGDCGELVPLDYWYFEQANQQHIAWAPNRTKLIVNQFVPLEGHEHLIGVRVTRKKKENGDDN